QLFGTSEHRFTFRTAGGDKQHWKLIDSQRHERRRDIDTLQSCVADANISDRLTTDRRLVGDLRLAPMRRSMSMIPVRVGFTPTCLSVTSASGAIDAATMKNAADEISAGTSIWQAVRD